MAFDFPNSPALNDTFVVGGVTYAWNGYAWVPNPQTGTYGFLLWPAGIGVEWFGIALPAGTRWCDGALYEKAAYPALFTAISITYGESGTKFAVPDERGRLSAGRDDMGGTAANRLTTAGGGVDGKTLGAVGGTETHTLSTAQMPPHTHTYSRTSAGTYGAGAISGPVYAYEAIATTSVGSGQAHPNVQPGLVCNKLITTGGVA